MAIYHLTTNIEGLLRNYKDKRLGKFFDMDGAEARKQLQLLLDKGDRLLPSEGCKHFDPQMGCRCRYYNEDGSLIIIQE
jgi:hypothetical protein